MLHDANSAGGPEGGPTVPVGSAASDGLVLLLPESALAHRMGDAAHLWLVDQSNPTRGTVARMGEVGFTRADDGLVRITRGLRPGDRVIVDPPPNLSDGSRIRIIGEMEEE
jgi:multidrug efflux pump subunit AcrA (membrane-fusion protein)